MKLIIIRLLHTLVMSIIFPYMFEFVTTMFFGKGFPIVLGTTFLNVLIGLIALIFYFIILYGINFVVTAKQYPRNIPLIKVFVWSVVPILLSIAYIGLTS